MRLAASCFAVVRRFDDDDDDSEGGVDDPLPVVSVAELDADVADVPRLGALLDRIPVDVLSKSWVFEAGRGLDSSYEGFRVQNSKNKIKSRVYVYVQNCHYHRRHLCAT